MRAIAVDDDVRMHSILEKMLARINAEVTIVANAYSVDEAVELIKNHQPELLLLDIELPDGTGFDVLEQIDPTQFHFIFITGHSGYALRALDFNALHYLIKPLQATKLKEALRRIEERSPGQRKASELGQDIHDARNSMLSKDFPKHLKIQNSDGFFPLVINDIVLIKSANGQITVVMQDGREVRKSASLSDYVRFFDGHEDFTKIHQSFLINLNHLKAIGTGSVVVMSSDESIQVSHTVAKRLRDLYR